MSDDRVDSIYDLGEIRDQFGVHARNATVYGGWSRWLINGWASRLTVGATYDDSHFDSIVRETGPTAVVPRNRKLVYPWVGYEWVFEGGVSRGFVPGERHRLLLSSTLAGRRDSGQFADVQGGVEARHYFRQSQRRLLFIGASVDAGSNLDLDHQILLGGAVSADVGRTWGANPGGSTLAGPPEGRWLGASARQ